LNIFFSSAIGDASCDSAPLQVTKFGEGNEIDEILSKMFLEGGGGGNGHESYELAAFFYNAVVNLKNPGFPFFFVTGDEKYFETLTGKTIKTQLDSNPR